jgi:amidase
MTIKPLHELSATESAAAIAARKLTSTQLVEACLAHIGAREPTVEAWAHLDRAYVLAQAKARDAETPIGPLHGVPVGIKDIIDTADLPTEYGSPIYAGHRPGYDAACVALVRRAGGIIMGKTVTTEFAAFHPGKTANPKNPAHTPGGSSSGSAAAVADFHVPIAFGTQTAGSINRPAAFCGAVGFKPSFGTYVMNGVKPEAPSFDTLGTITRTVDDALLMWRVLQSGDLPPVTPLPARPWVALCQTPFWSAASTPAREAWRLAGQKLAAADFDVDEVELPEWFESLEATHKLVLDYEAARTLAYEYEKPRRDKLSPEFREMLERGFSHSPQRYMEARRDMARARKEFAELVSRFDALMAPAAPGEAPAGLGATGNPIFNRLPTLLHVPSLNIPVTTGPKGLPLGVQFIGGFDNDLSLLQLGQLVTERAGLG